MEVRQEPASPPAAEDGRESRRRHGLLDRLGFWLFLAMVVLAPIPDGSVALIWIQFWIVIAALALLCVSFREVPPGVVPLLWGLVVVLAGYGTVAWLQSISPGPAPLAVWSEAARILGTEIPPLSSSARNSPLLFLGRPLLAALVLGGALVIGTDRHRAGVVLRAIVGAACVYGLIGLIGLAFDIDQLRPFEQGGALTTFFLNKNTSAIYLGSAFLIVFAMLLPPALAAVREHRPLASLFKGGRDGRRRVMATAAGLFVLVLLPLTLSRAGLMLTVFVALVALAVKLRVRRRSTLWKVGLGILVLFSFIYALSGESWRERQARVGFDSLGRLDAYEMMLGAAADHPLLGLGLGSFAQSFPQFRTDELGFSGIFDIGHSTPIELIYEGGYPLALLVFAYVGICAVVLVRGAIRRPSDPYVLAGLLVGSVGLLHTSFDFPLQIPGFLIIYLAVVGIGISRAFLPREERRVVRKKVRRRPSGTASASNEATDAAPASVSGSAASV